MTRIITETLGLFLLAIALLGYLYLIAMVGITRSRGGVMQEMQIIRAFIGHYKKGRADFMTACIEESIRPVSVRCGGRLARAANSLYLEMMRLDRPQLNGRSFRHIFHPDDIAAGKLDDASATFRELFCNGGGECHSTTWNGIHRIPLRIIVHRVEDWAVNVLHVRPFDKVISLAEHLRIRQSFHKPDIR